jgi:hypothetical protein
MHPRTVATLEELDRADWFARVGVKDTDAAVVVSSWGKAIEHCTSAKWENLCLEAVNRYCERLRERSKGRFNRWNEVVDEVKRATEPLVRRKVEAAVRANHLPPEFEHAVEWDVLHVGMEAEYADIYPPGFYASQAYWYVHGHFPCGWQGKFPAGKLIVY